MKTWWMVDVVGEEGMGVEGVEVVEDVVLCLVRDESEDVLDRSPGGLRLISLLLAVDDIIAGL